jgi:hypothetical protein
MRTIISLMIFLLNQQYCFSQGNKTDYTNCIKVDIGPYTTFNKVKRVFAITSKDTSTIYMIGVIPTNSEIRTLGLKCDGPVFYLHYSDTLYNTLKRVEEKYKEWTEVAKNNLTEPFKKEIPVELPIAGVSIWNIDKPQFELMPVDKNRYTFDKVNLKDPPCIHLHMFSHFNYFNSTFRKKVKASTEVVSFFSDTEQFSKFIELLAPDKIRKNMGNNTIDELFK